MSHGHYGIISTYGKGVWTNMDGPYHEYKYPCMTHIWEKIEYKVLNMIQSFKTIIVWLCAYVCINV